MAAQNQAFQIPLAACQGIAEYCKAAAMQLNSNWQIRSQLINMDAAYMREAITNADHIRAKIANSYGDKSKIQDVTVPIVMPQVEAGVSYLAGVFLQGNPIFGITSENKENIDAALMYDTIMEENAIRGGWTRQLNMMFRDGLKHNIMAAEVCWEKKRLFSLTNDMSFKAGKQGKPTEIVWEGNTIKRMDMYNTIFDTRVQPAEISKHGEFAGKLELLSRIALKQLIQELGDDVITANVKAAFESGSTAQETFFIPTLNPQALIADANLRGAFNWASWANDEAMARIRYSNMYEVATYYARIIPSDFGLKVPARNLPQIWKFIVVNGQQVILAERQTNAHDLLPMVFGQPLEDGLGYQTKSFAANVAPLQDAATAMMNGTLASKRRLVHDRLLYNPSLVRPEDINSTNPIARIPVKPAAYNKNLQEAVYAFPYNDSASGNMLQEMQLISGFANQLQGINQAQQGQFVKGNKTLHEFDTIMGNSNARLQTMAMFIEAQTMVPIKEMLKLNILQYAADGQIFNRDKKQLVKIDPMALRSASLEYQVSDGLLPSDKILNSDVMQVALQVIGTQPQLMQQFDIVGLLMYHLKSQGAKNIDQFRIMPAEQAAATQQAQVASGASTQQQQAMPATPVA